MPLRNYNFKDGNILVLGGEKIGGFGEDGGVEYELASDTYEDVNGADSITTISQLNDPRMYANITVMETSSSYRVLFGLWKTQKEQLIKQPMPFLHKDIINGDSTKAVTAVFMAPPVPSKARTAGERVFRILLPDGVDLMVLGANNLTNS